MLGEKRKPVSFNLDNPEEKRLYEWSKTVNFSRFVKLRMMQELHLDDEGWSEPVQHNATQSKSK